MIISEFNERTLSMAYPRLNISVRYPNGSADASTGTSHGVCSFAISSDKFPALKNVKVDCLINTTGDLDVTIHLVP